MPFWYIAKFVEGRYKLEACLVLISVTCELNKNWSLFLITNRSIEYAYWELI